MDWIDVKDRMPEGTIEVLVVNMAYGMGRFKAIYHKSYNVFVLYNPDVRDTITLDVTHWIAIPDLPKEDNV